MEFYRFLNLDEEAVEGFRECQCSLRGAVVVLVK